MERVRKEGQRESKREREKRKHVNIHHILQARIWVNLYIPRSVERREQSFQLIVQDESRLDVLIKSVQENWRSGDKRDLRGGNRN